MFAKFAIAAIAAVLAAANALPATAKPPVRNPSTMPDRTPAPPVSVPSRQTSGTMNAPSQQPASGSASSLPVR